MLEVNVETLVLETGRSDSEVDKSDPWTQIRGELGWWVPGDHEHEEWVNKVYFLVTYSDQHPPSCFVQFFVQHTVQNRIYFLNILY